jgi:hypothetical protein
MTSVQLSNFTEQVAGTALVDGGVDVSGGHRETTTATEVLDAVPRLEVAAGSLTVSGM